MQVNLQMTIQMVVLHVHLASIETDNCDLSDITSYHTIDVYQP